MKRFEDYNPVVIFIFFVAITITAMFCMDFILLSISLLGGLAYYITIYGAFAVKKLWWYLLVILSCMIINPIFSHNGKTVLFMLNGMGVTAEALLYGLALGMMITAMLLWFRIFSQIMTSDKLLYVFGYASPKLALILSMTLRYIPLYKKQAKKINMSQRAIGLYKEDNFLDKLRGGMRIFSVMVTWALENGVTTADSMVARGYGSRRRTRFAIFRWNAADITMLIITILLIASTAFMIALSKIGFDFYPQIQLPAFTLGSAIGYIAYAILALAPTFINIREELSWKSLTSKI